MDEQSLALSFSNSLTEEVSGITGEYVEIGLDALIEDGPFKDIPIVSTFMSVYRIGNSIWERHHVAKLIAFLNEINKGIVDEEKREKYREKFSGNDKFRNQELEYILILIDRYISFDKPQMLAKLYLAYLDCKITWQEFTQYAEIIDRFLPGDLAWIDEHRLSECTPNSIAVDGVLRLISMGLVTQKWRKASLYDGYGKNIGGVEMKGYELTSFGMKFRSLIL